MKLSDFFPTSCPRGEVEVTPTVLLVPQQDNERTILVPTCIETHLDPLSALTFSDFSLSNLIKNGVSYKSLNINPDLRLGLESQINEFNSRLEDIADQLFNNKN